jgi:hypothetical protein
MFFDHCFAPDESPDGSPARRILGISQADVLAMSLIFLLIGDNLPHTLHYKNCGV